MHIGLIGLQQSGKSTLFQVITGSEPNSTASHKAGKYVTRKAVVQISDPCLEQIHTRTKTEKMTPVSIEFIDMAGMDRSEVRHKPESTVDFSPVAQVDLFLAVLRSFRSDVVAHPAGTVDPLRDMKTIESELILRDLEIVESRLSRLKKSLSRKSLAREHKEVEILERCLQLLSESVPLRNETFPPEDLKILRGFQFVSQKPVLRIFNMDDRQLERADALEREYQSAGTDPQTDLALINAKLELELAQLSEAERKMFMEDLQITTLAGQQVIHKTYHLLGLVTYYTFGETETRAWSIPRGTKAAEAAGAIHSDMERGFIRAETVQWDKFVREGSIAHCKEKGLMRFEGKEYTVQDGDLIYFHFHV